MLQLYHLTAIAFSTIKPQVRSSSRACASIHDFFSYTSGRWIVNEPARLAERYQAFDIDALKAVAARAGGGRSVMDMAKIGEGTFNKAFLMTLDTGREVVARIPNPLYGRPHPILTSEVATMNYVRDRLGVPVPKVLDWCSDKNSTPVQAAYMIMGKAPGVNLAKVWNRLDLERRIQITREIATVEETLAQATFPVFGSLYQKVDMIGQPHEALPGDDTYAIGPCTKLPWWNDGRDSMGINRGPWRHTRDYLKAVAERERQWIATYRGTGVRPRSVPITKRESERDPRELQDLLELYISVIDQIIPPSEIFPTAHTPTLCHPDLSLHNIFVSSTALEQGGELKITSLIDWSSSWVGPRFIHPHPPSFLHHTDTPPGTQRASSPSQSDEREKADAQVGGDLETYRNAYEEKRKSYDPTLIAYHHNNLARTATALMSWSGHIWDNKFVPMRKVMYDVQFNWASLSPAGTPCPIRYSDEDKDLIQSEANAWQENEDTITELEKLLGTDREGFVHPEDYEAVQAVANEFWEKLVAHEDPAAQGLRELWPWGRP